jgi:hypothetical protein
MHQLKDKHNDPLLNYRHDLKQQNKLSLLPNISFGNDCSTSANKIVASWSDFAKDALIGEHRESSLVCWDGHYEQFGRLMYEFYTISANRSVRLANYHIVMQNTFPHVKSLGFIPAGPCSSVDATLYRAWFSMLGHPDFSEPLINSPEPHVYTYWKHWLKNVYFDLRFNPA